jgi:hypothetical protein
MQAPPVVLVHEASPQRYLTAQQADSCNAHQPGKPRMRPPPCAAATPAQLRSVLRRCVWRIARDWPRCQA